MKRLGAVRAGWGTLQIVAPGLIAGCVAGHQLDRRGRRVVRVLGARHLLQAVVSGRDPAYPVLALGVEVDLAHALSMVGLGAVDRVRRRVALADAAVAVGFAAAGGLAARRSRSAPAGRWGLRDRTADRLARRLVPGYPAVRPTPWRSTGRTVRRRVSSSSKAKAP